MFPQVTGYDRAITVFSPDGRLLQVEYALSATKRTPLAIGMKCKDGVVLLAVRKYISPLATPPEKIYKIDDHIGAIAAGLVGDGLVLIERGRVEAQYNKLVYGEPITVKNLAKRIALYKQQFTQYAGLRPFGAMIILGGIDEGPELYVTHPGGAYYDYMAFAVGKNSDKVNEIFRQTFKQEFSLDECLSYAVKVAMESEEEEVNENYLEVAVIELATRKFRELSREEIAIYVRKSGEG
ncbi:MAG: archaeal proteasome endopeptidase complex subunit alpha, partial [Candidatus Korarchaeum sp.]|nr:archaeal proteasome endopeptidase complex subunit alpha [Candidatus Korarchaeum sp.]MDW8036140.1 archaeal proteasome endopeptidase complex subunit alpha [Candidatus Korarchaeum sp.]